MKKRILLMFLAAVFVIGIAGCANNSGGANAAVQSHLYRVIDAGKIRVGAIPDNPGWSVLGSDGSWTGYDIDIANKLASVLGVTVEFVPVGGPERLPAIQADTVDVVIASFTATSERAKSVTFSHAYASSGILGLCKASNVFQSWDELDGKRISVPRGTTADIFITNTFPNAEIVRFDAIADAFIALQTDKVDVMMEDDPAVYDLAEKNPDMVPMPVDPMSPTYLCFGLAHGDSIWLAYLNQFITDNLYSGDFATMYYKNFGRKLPKLVTY